jgi:hypothetical protein
MIGGSHASDFIVTGDPISPISANGSTTFVITFTPGGIGTRTATVSIANDDPDENPYNFTITGNGIGIPEINVKQGETSIPHSTGTYNFGNVKLGENSPVTLSIENLGTADLNLTGTSKIEIIGIHAGDFKVTGPPVATIPAGGSTSFDIVFTPGGTGVRNAIVYIMNDDLDENPYTFEITGSGVVPDITLTRTLVLFGSVLIGNAKNETIWVRNEGTADLTIGNIGNLPAPFSKFTDNCSNQTIAPGLGCEIVVRFTPESDESFTSSIDIPSDDPDESNVAISVSGRGERFQWVDLGPNGETIYAIIIDPTNDNTILIGTGNGLFKSTDGGSSWVALGFQQQYINVSFR